MQLNLPAQVPKPANFVLVKLKDGTISVPVEHLTEEQINEYANEVKESILIHWKEKTAKK